jgi:hypothetical protein
MTPRDFGYILRTWGRQANSDAQIGRLDPAEFSRFVVSNQKPPTDVSKITSTFHPAGIQGLSGTIN